MKYIIVGFMSTILLILIGVLNDPPPKYDCTEVKGEVSKFMSICLKEHPDVSRCADAFKEIHCKEIK